MANLRFQVVAEAFKKKPLEVKTPAERPCEFFGKNVFTREKMYKYLPKDVYEKLVDVIDNGTRLDRSIADAVAAGIKQWAVENGVTHYTHWFQPLTEGTAEKHDSFIEHDHKGGMVEEFSGKLLVQQEPDASSFPNGGIRNTFEARGYSAWDPTSPVFIIDDTLCIPTIFISYTGEALDYKAPLLRTLHAVNVAATDVCRYFYPDVKKVQSNLGWEQEYFLVDEGLYSARPDLLLTGRTLMGHDSAKNQQMDDHYFGTIPDRVQAFMKDLEIRALELAIPCKTRHNEVAPNQFELAPIYEECNLAVDHNMLLMSLMKRVARKHGFRVLLHEKPFAGINGSGKHNNWSISTNTGVNLLDPGRTPAENAQFLLFLTAVIKAVNEYQDILRASVASAGNDHRLGANEAPPAIISIFLGDELTGVLDAIVNGVKYEDKRVEMEIGVDVLPHFPKDTTDRNRTSPFAFTGNKFEFRMPGSKLSVAGPNTVLNTIVAEALDEFADELEKADNFQDALDDLIKRTIKENQDIIFNGNGYSEEWPAEAEKRGLLNLKSTPAAVPAFLAQKNIDLFSKYGVYTETELQSRVEILLDEYCKTLNIEALTMIDMAKKEILPAAAKYIKDLAKTAELAKACGAETVFEDETVKEISALTTQMYKALNTLEEDVQKVHQIEDTQEMANFFHDTIFADMGALRVPADKIETLVGKEYWPYPTYSDLLFYVK